MSSIPLFWPSLQAYVLAAVISSGLMAPILLALTAVAAAMLKRRGASAAARCQLWLATIVCLLALPLASQLLPVWNLSRAPDALTAATPVTVLPDVPPETTDDPVAFAATGSFVASTDTASPTAAVTAAAPARTAPPRDAIQPAQPAAWWPALWLAGFGAVLASTALGWCSLLQLRWTTVDAADPGLLRELHDAKNQLGIRRDVRLIVGQRRAIPMTWGLWRPMIHLPAAAAGWSAVGRRAVLLHELAHIRRHDYLAQLLARLVCALYWYNPLAWYALRRLRAEQEAACDDAVLNQGADAACYARHLLQIVVGGGRCRWEAAAALAAGRAGRLEQRVAAILNTTRNRRPPSLRQSVLSSTLIVAAALLVASAGPLKFAAAQAAAEKPADQASDQEPAATSLAGIRDVLLENYVRELDGASITRSAIEGMLASLDDPYSQYISADELAVLKIGLEGELTGIGAHLKAEDGQAVISFPLPGSPALRAGLEPGDVILEIDAAPTNSLEINEVASRIRGPAGTVVTLKIQRDGNIREVPVTRGKIQLPSVRGLRGMLAAADGADRFLIDAAGGIGYVRLSGLSENTPAELRQVLEELVGQGMQGAILDLRYCPGGSLNSAVAVASLFLRNETVVVVRGRDGKESRVPASADAHVGDFPMVVIVNEQTASAAEVVAGALQDHGRAKIVGTRTFGKASVQSLIPLSDELGAIKLTTAFYCLPNGRCIDRLPGAATWGIDADGGYFVPVSADQRDRLQQRFQSGDAASPAPRLDPITPETLRDRAGDPQLAAALQTMQARLQTGEFLEVGGTRKQLEDYVIRLEIQRRHAKLLETLGQLDELAGELQPDDAGGRR